MTPPPSPFIYLRCAVRPIDIVHILHVPQSGRIRHCLVHSREKSDAAEDDDEEKGSVETPPPAEADGDDEGLQAVVE